VKRRALITSTFVSAVSAAVFSTSGWLMGTRSLTMYNWTPSPYPDCCYHGWDTGFVYAGCYNRPGGGCPPNYGNCFSGCQDYWCAGTGTLCMTNCTGNMNTQCCNEATCNP
jgi:hypothetical protein